MKAKRVQAVLDRALRGKLPPVSKALARHIAKLSKLDPVDIEELMQTEAGMQWLAHGMRWIPGRDGLSKMARDLPKFSDLREAEPGRMTDEEYARVLSGATRHESAGELRRKSR